MRRGIQLAVYVTQEIAAQARGAASALRRSVSSIVEDALAEHLTDLQQQHNQGNPFPPRDGAPRRGRRPLPVVGGGDVQAE